jgi:hypothetical protein
MYKIIKNNKNLLITLNCLFINVYCMEKSEFFSIINHTDFYKKQKALKNDQEIKEMTSDLISLQEKYETNFLKICSTNRDTTLSPEKYLKKKIDSLSFKINQNEILNQSIINKIKKCPRCSINESKCKDLNTKLDESINDIISYQENKENLENKKNNKKFFTKLKNSYKEINSIANKINMLQEENKKIKTSDNKYFTPTYRYLKYKLKSCSQSMIDPRPLE